jgi:hypothetical protein
MPLVSYLVRNAADAEETYGKGFANRAPRRLAGEAHAQRAARDTLEVYRIQAAGYPSMSLAGS